MQLRTLIFGGAAIVTLVVVRPWQTAEPVARAAPVVAQRSARVALPSNARARSPQLPRDTLALLEDVELIGDGFDDETVEDDHDFDEALGEHGALRGRIYDHETGEDLVGATVVATSPGVEGEQAAITDNNGYYEIRPLKPGAYLVTIYYLNATLEFPNVVVHESLITPVFARVEMPTYQPLHPLPAEIDEPRIEEHGHGFTIDPIYVRNIPVPIERTFEGQLAPDPGEETEEEDNLGVTFSGGTFVDNEYVIE